jgi:hypothetical protein
MIGRDLPARGENETLEQTMLLFRQVHLFASILFSQPNKKLVCYIKFSSKMFLTMSWQGKLVYV